MHQRNRDNNNDVVIAVVVAAMAATIGIAYAVKQWKPIEIKIGSPVTRSPPAAQPQPTVPADVAPLLREPELALQPHVELVEGAGPSGRRYFAGSTPAYTGLLR